MASFGENAVHAYANINQSGSQSIVDSYNITSVTDNTVGKTTFNFSTNAANDDYAFISSAGNASGTTTSGRTQNPDEALSVSSFRIRNFNATAGTTKDDTYVGVIVISDS
tara:strand:- start:12 stop:341 length:330 start_codon:yes stop_codon:yes gene_type:complete